MIAMSCTSPHHIVISVETFIEEKSVQSMSKAREGPEANFWSNQSKRIIVIPVCIR